MNKISRGAGFAGVVKYLQYGSKCRPRAKHGVVIGGNVSGLDSVLITQELAATKKIRPDVKKPVWHNSLRLPAGDTLTYAKWNEIADEYMRRMGFTDLNPRAYYLHDEEDGQHIHILASRIAYDGKLYLGKQEGLISTRIISQLEIDFGLRRTRGAKYRGSRGSELTKSASLKKIEISKSVGADGNPSWQGAQNKVQEVSSYPMSTTSIVCSQGFAEQDVAEESQAAESELVENHQQKKNGSQHGKIVCAVEGFGFAMKRKIKTKKVRSNGADAVGTKTRNNTATISVDAASASK